MEAIHKASSLSTQGEPANQCCLYYRYGFGYLYDNGHNPDIAGTDKRCVPEVNRSRSLYVKAMTSRDKEQHNNAASSQMSVTTAHECFKTLTIPEAVTITSINNKMRASLPGGGRMSVDEMETDEAFWHVFSFEFLCGKPYTKADFDSGLSKAVVSASVARRLFGTTDVAGCTIQLNKADYTITGVVKDVSNLATASYAQVWIPYTSTNLASFHGEKI